MNTITLQRLAASLQKIIKREQGAGFSTLFFIWIGILCGVMMGMDYFPTIHFLNVLTKLSGLGISITTVAGVVYNLYKEDVLNENKREFLADLQEDINAIPNMDTQNTESIVMEIVKKKVLG